MDWFSGKSLCDIVHRVFYLYKDKECVSNIENGSISPYTTYSEVYKDCMKLFYSLRSIPKRSVVGLLCRNSSNYLISDITCVLSDFISVGIHLSWNSSKISSIITSTDMKCIIMDSSKVSILESIEPSVLSKIQKIIIIGSSIDLPENLPKHVAIEFWENIKSSITDEDIQEHCKPWNEEPYAFPKTNENEQEACTIMFTSGSTGNPKGVVITKKRWKRDFLCFPFAGCDKPLTILNHMSLAHGADRVLCWQMLHAGGRIAFSNPKSHEELMNFIQLVKPTFFLALSHFWSRVYLDYRKELSRRTMDRISCTYQKIKEYNESKVSSTLPNSPLLDSFANFFDIRSDVIEEIREVWFGGRIFTPVTGGAHTSELVLNWMKEVFAPKTTSGEEQGSRVQNAYGSTEFTGISVNGEISQNIELKLIDVPEMNYRTTDKPYSRGEILVRYKDSSIGVEYWKLESPIDKDGWYHTGDIGLLNTKQRDEFDYPTLEIIDRRKNMIEIYDNGDSIWIPVEKLEKQIFNEIIEVKDICLLADRNSPGIIAICISNSSDITEKELLSSFHEIGRKNNLTRYEIPIAVIIHNSSFPITDSGKIQRGKVQLEYQSKMEEIYSNYERNDEIQITTVKDVDLDVILQELKDSKVEPEMIPQNTKCDDFIDFRFIGPNEEITKELNEMFIQMRDDVLIIRKESAIWRKETKERINNATERVLIKVQEINSSVNEMISKYIKNIQSMNAEEINQETDKIVQLFSKRQCEFVRLFNWLKEIESTQHERHKEVTDRYGRTLQQCMKLADKYSIRVPYQIWAAGWWKAPGSTEDPANLLTTPLGTAEVYCCVSGERIEKDISEVGKLRWHCIDSANIDHSIETHQQLIDIRNALRRKFTGNEENIQYSLNLWELIDPYEDKEWIQETAHFWHLRTSIDEDLVISPGLFFINACKSYANRPALGIPNSKLISNESIPKYILSSPFVQALGYSFTESNSYLWINYSQVYELSCRVAKILLSLPGITSTSKIGICGYNTIEWAICDFACSLIGCVSIGLHTTNSDELCQSVIETAKISCIICTADRMKSIQQNEFDISFNAENVLPKCSSVKHLLIMDKSLVDMENDISSKFSPIEVNSLVDLLPKVEQFENITLPDSNSFNLDELATILFTSGSSGKPKGVMVSKRSFYNDISQRVFVEPLITPSYIPLSHSSDRMKMWEFLGNGGRVGFAYYGAINWIEHERDKKEAMIELKTRSTNNVEQLFSQISMLSPTAMSCPPRIWSGLHSLYLYLIDSGLSINEAKQNIKDLFGNRIKFLITGGGPTPPEIYNFFKELFKNISFCDSYGATECGAITSNGYPITSKGISVKLGPLKALNLNGDVNSNDIGAIGEILVCSPNMSSGYFGSEELTKEVFIDGWYHTGDIGMRIDFDKYKIIGRVSSAISIKGNLTFLGPLETSLECCPDVSQICLHYDSKEELLIAIVVPVNQNITDVELVSNLNLLLSSKTKDITIDRLVLSPTPWTLENGMLTAQLKIARKNIINKYL